MLQRSRPYAPWFVRERVVCVCVARNTRETYSLRQSIAARAHEPAQVRLPRVFLVHRKRRFKCNASATERHVNTWDYCSSGNYIGYKTIYQRRTFIKFAKKPSALRLRDRFYMIQRPKILTKTWLQRQEKCRVSLHAERSFSWFSVDRWRPRRTT